MEAESLRVLEFWCTHQRPTDCTGRIMYIEIQGIHRYGEEEDKWFFFGRERALILLPDGPMEGWKAPSMDFAFGTWDTQHRKGAVMMHKNGSFFTAPMTEREIFERAYPTAKKRPRRR
ncbi:MAG: hypothetical protein JWN18_411 [Parcubacteria group bacterium]|nr:hypothetical protein [Parcubacteria group bacterium]